MAWANLRADILELFGEAESLVERELAALARIDAYHWQLARGLPKPASRAWLREQRKRRRREVARQIRELRLQRGDPVKIPPRPREVCCVGCGAEFMSAIALASHVKAARCRGRKAAA